MRLVLKNGFMVLAILFAHSLFAQGDSDSPKHVQRYVIELQDAPLASYGGERLFSASGPGFGELLDATSSTATGRNKLDVRTPESQAYLEHLDLTHSQFRLEAEKKLGRTIKSVNDYRNAFNGMSMDITTAEADNLQKSPLVKSISKDTRHRLETFAGPPWIGAGDIWSGQSGFPSNKGEGIVIGIIDSGINYDHPSFADPAGNGYNHVNPFGTQLGLCSQAEVLCNDKLIGVYDFVEDDPDTEDVVEEGNNGKDNFGHGSHVAGIAAGNQLNIVLEEVENTTLSGVAPNANIVSYRVCYIGDPPESDGGGCLGSAILSAIDQAIEDGVDIINYSIGSSTPISPWSSGNIPLAFLNAREAGIFVATSASNDGPNPGTIGTPANAPWIVAAGNSTHNRIFGSLVQDFSGGDTTPPGDLVGESLTEGIGKRKIVRARDFGFPLCGTGPDESASTCEGNLGNSNPWAGQTPFNGEIVICERGDYGRIEKGKNVMLAGAGGYILANTEEWGGSLRADNHCLPGSHISYEDAMTLNNWVSSGSNHQGSISGFHLAESDDFADKVASSSSRGPNVYRRISGQVVDIDALKPNLIAPGTSIISAWKDGSDLVPQNGTSMASPHVAGAAALVLAVHPDWSVSQIVSSLELTASAALAKDIDGSPATPHVRGSGRPQLGDAVNAGLFLDEVGANFAAADPSAGGDPKSLNLTGLVDSTCTGVCEFDRTVTDQMGGGSWSATAINFPAGTQVKINPSIFTLSNGSSKSLNIEIDLEANGIIGEWVYGDILLTAAGSPDLMLTVAVNSDGGDLPDEWSITDQRNFGWEELEISDLAALPDTTIVTGGLIAPRRTVMTLKEDPTNEGPGAEKAFSNFTEHDNPFDGGEGVFTVWHNLPEGGLWLHAETLGSSAVDVDLFVGRDDNFDGIADEDETICVGGTISDVELCDLFNVSPGNYWIVVQNFDGTIVDGDEVTLVSAGVVESDDSSLVVTGPGQVKAKESFTLRASWNNINALSAEQWLGAIGLGSNRDNPNNIGVIPVKFNRNGFGNPQTLPLMNGHTHKLGLAGNTSHSRMFIDVPSDVTSLNVMAQGDGDDQSNGLKLELFREDFNAALSTPPFVSLPGGLGSEGSATGSAGTGPSVTINGPVTPGRYYVELSNTSDQAASISVVATVDSPTSSLTPRQGLWDFISGISQGAEWNTRGNFNFSLWFTYDDSGQPIWYIASNPKATGNIWTADLLYVTNDGMTQQEKKVGSLSITFVADDLMIFSYSFQGQAGSDPLEPNSRNTCPTIDGGLKSYTGHWYRGIAGLGGATVMVYRASQAQIHYLFDASGMPRWVIAADDENQSATGEVIPMLQFEGFCATCTQVDVTFQTIGKISRTFATETTGSWKLDFDLASPLSGGFDRTDSIQKLSDSFVCPP